MALTLLEASKLMLNRGEVQRSAIVETYPRSSDILRVLPFRDIPGNAYAYNQEQTLPGIGFRGVNASYTASTGVINPEVEPLVIAGGDLAVDPFIIKTGGEGVREQHKLMKVKALALAVTKTIIKGNSTTTPAEFDGLQIRLTGDQLIAAGSTNTGDALSLALLDALIDAVDDPTHLCMNKTMRRLLSVAARTTAIGGNLIWDKDDFGKRIAVYDDLPILIFDRDQTASQILAFDEAPSVAGGTSVSTSIYCISIGDGRYEGIQNGEPDPRSLGEQASTVTELDRVEWYMGQVLEHPRCASRIYGIINSPVVV